MDKIKKKIAIFHNFMDNIGGAELVDLMLARELNADIYTTNIDKEKIQKMGFNTNNVYSIGKVPLNAPFRQEIAYWRFRKLNLGKKYDFYVIAGDWAMSGCMKNKPHFWYVYSPTREIWDLYKDVREKNVPFFLRYIYDLWVLFRRRIYRRDCKKVSKLITTSRNVQKRIIKYFKRDSRIIYPPVDISKYKYNKHKGYWLSVNRLFGHKRVDMQMKAFSKLPNEKLIVVGSYEKSKHFIEYANYINKIKPSNVKIISWIDDKILKELYSNCKGFITTSIDEDFGLTPIEAMASGKPVIAPNEGGYKETIIDGKTGRLIDDIDVDKLIDAVKEVGKNPEKYKQACLKQAKKFDLKRFVKEIRKEIEKEINLGMKNRNDLT